MELTEAEVANSPRLPRLIAGLETEAVIADKGDDSDSNRQAIRAQGAEPCITPRCNRKMPQAYDRHLYKERNVVSFRAMRQWNGLDGRDTR